MKEAMQILIDGLKELTGIDAAIAAPQGSDNK
jgi:hypothetical protein